MDAPAAPGAPVNLGASTGLPHRHDHPPPAALPQHLQHAVHRALSDLQAARLLYPQQCAQAEAAGGDARQEAEGRARAALGGTFDYATARAELDRGRQAARKLAGRKGGSKGGAAAEETRTAAPSGTGAAAVPPSALPMRDADLWSSYEALSAAVAAEVDARIASAALLPTAPCQPTRQLERKQAGPAARRTAAPRPPLGRVQQQANAPAAHERKRDRSPQADAPAAPAPAAAGGRGRRQGQAVPTAAAQAGSPASKRPKPHVAFGTRCDGPRLAARGSRPMRLEASAAPTPPALPPAEPEAGKRHGDAGRAPPQAAAATARSDLLRSLAAAFAGGAAADGAPAAEEQEERQRAVPGGAAGGAAWPAAAAPQGHPEELLRMLEQLTAGLQPPPAAGHRYGGSAAQQAAGGGVHGVLQQHGLAASAAGSASALLQAVLDRMDEVAARTAAPGPHVPGAPPAAACQAEGAASLAGCSPAAQLCSQAGELLDSSAAELGRVCRQLEAVQRLEAAAERVGDAAVQAALAGAEAAAQTAAAQAAAQAARARAAGPPALPEPAAAAEGTHGNGQECATTPQLPAPPSAAEERPEAGDAALDGAAADLHAVLRAGQPSSSSPAAADAAAHAEPTPRTAAAPPQQSEPAGPAQPARPAGPAPDPAAAAPAAAFEAPLPSAEPAPATGWPVPWQLPSAAPAMGVPLLLPGPGQPQWLLPAAPGGGFGWGHLMAPAAQPLLIASGQAQPAALPAGQLQQEPPQVDACQHGGSFSVASDEPLEQSPDCGASSASEDGQPAKSLAALGVEQEQQQHQQQQLTTGSSAAGEAEAQQQQQQCPEKGGENEELRVREGLAALSLRQHQQEPGCEEEAEADLDAANEAGGPVEAALDGSALRGGAPWPGRLQAGSVAAPGAAAGALGASAPAAAPESSRQPAGAGCDLQRPVAASEAAALVAAAAPAAEAVPLRRGQPYQPLRVAEQRAAAARQQEATAGWRQLRERADMLALWHQYASELGIADSQQPARSAEAVAPAVAAPPAAQVAMGVAVPRRLWQHSQQLAGTAAADQLPSLATPPAPHSVGSSDCIGDAPLTGSSSPFTPLTASIAWSEDSGATSLGVAGRHKARALRYRLLRRQLAAAAGLQATPLGTEAGSPALSLMSSGSGGLTASSSSGSGSSPLTDSTCGAAEQAPAAARFAAGEAVDPEEEPPATPTAAAVSAGAAGAAVPGGGAAAAPALPSLRLASNLADHLSDATPSSCQAGAATPPSASSCSPLSTLQDVGTSPWGIQLGPQLAAAAAAAAPSVGMRAAGAAGGGRGLEALRALKDRVAAGRRSPGICA